MVKFHLDKKEGQESPIFLSLYHRGKRLKVYTEKKIDVAKWDIKTCRANPRKYKNNCLGFNNFLDGIKDNVESLVNENRPISKADLKAIVDKANGKDTDNTFFGFAESYIQTQLANNVIKPNSAKGYRTTLKHLRAFNPSLAYNDITLDFYDRFVTYLKLIGRAPNSIGTTVKHLKWFMAAALDRDHHTNVSFKKKSFKTIIEETDQIYLTRKELRQLAQKPLPERLKKVADAFVLNSYLGMRFSDLDQIQKDNFKKDDNLFHLHMVQGKTGAKITIPVPNEALPILKKYKFNCPVINAKGKLISVQKFNDYLKEAAEAAGIDAIEDIRKGGKVEKLPKYSLIKSHTARRAFATNLFLDGVPIQNIMAITGHKEESTFLLYVRADQLTKAKGLAKHYQQKNKPEMKVTKGGKAAA
jgi:site-specific recombinase XerD